MYKVLEDHNEETALKLRKQYWEILTAPNTRQKRQVLFYAKIKSMRLFFWVQFHKAAYADNSAHQIPAKQK